MKQNLTELVFILDRSGSMSGLETETIGGYNSLLKKQKKMDGEANVTTILFNQEYEILHDRKPIRDVKPISSKEYYACGFTALLDAIGVTIEQLDEKIERTSKNARPDKVMIVITTDGYENASRNYSKERVRELIEKMQKRNDWECVFLGANMDAIQEACSLGIRPQMSRTYSADKKGVESIFNAVGQVVNALRSPRFLSKDEFYDACDSLLDDVK
jgi:uncharacterized protein YegL